ncbi:hypothetical protein BZA05DRAFT_167292 [Tricharina praecox]|uniref:uncharacterized protein n=1 Tax=Tricharina praecox TaxID=43433 RepID=UPI00221F51D3|nr:uncharacterized protein BZA05DRAFT_167292 [Tricharina praecox]KAI5857147.1 hypothetical protein BZA05DRAFT_167292 [Tricharina praecox]
MSAPEALVATPDVSASIPISQPTADSKTVGDEATGISSALEILSIDAKEKPQTLKDDTITREDASLPPGSSAVTLDEVTNAPASQLNGIPSVIRILSQNGDSTSASSGTSDRLSPVIVVSPQAQEPFVTQQLQTMLCDPVDQPDPRLIDALENPRDRIFVIKLEKDIVAFIENKNCEIFDMPPINSYHRLLAHKMAEYYRLTHVADSSGASVRMFRGEAARIPTTSLSAWPVAAQQIQKAVSSGVIPAVKIMRRGGGSDTPPRGSSKTRKAGSDTSSDNDNSVVTSNSKTTREEREAAYQQARARIFKDFVESPPETPPPGKQEKSRRQDKNDDFSGRSQFFPVMTQPYLPTHGYHDPMQPTMPTMSVMANMQPIMQPTMHQPLQQQQIPQNHISQQRFNPTANFTPSPQFPHSGPPPYSTLPSVRSYPNMNTRITTRGMGYPMPPTHQQPTAQPLYPQQQQPQPQQQQQNSSYYPNPAQSPQTMHSSRSFNPNLPQPQMMQSSYSSGGSGFQQHQSQHVIQPHHGMQPSHGMQSHHNMQPPQQFNNPATSPSLVNRSLQQQQQHYPLQHQMPFNVQVSPTPQRMPQQQQQPHLGWGNVGQQSPLNGGIAMAPRSSSAPGHHVMDGGMNGFGPAGGPWGGQHGGWNGGAVGGGAAGGGGGGMNMRM